jgi:hypothetical protein
MGRRVEKFEWDNPDWIPTRLQDKIWKKSGLESIKEYLNRMVKSYNLKEIASQLDMDSANVYRELKAHNIKIVWKGEIMYRIYRKNEKLF